MDRGARRGIGSKRPLPTIWEGERKSLIGWPEDQQSLRANGRWQEPWGGGSIDMPRDRQVALSIFTLTEVHQPLCKSSQPDLVCVWSCKRGFNGFARQRLALLTPVET